MVRMPRSCNRFSVTLPTPQIFETGNGASISTLFASVMTVSPSGLFKSDASLAKNLLGATPTEAVSPVWAWISALMLFAIVRASPNFLVAPVTSRNASSTETGCTNGVNVPRMVIICLETSPYFFILGRTKMPWGQSL